MLTKQHLSLFRAALRYFEDELCPHGIASQQPYFDEPLQVTWTSDEVQILREWLGICELKYACYDPSTMTVRGKMLSDSPEQARDTSGRHRDCFSMPWALFFKTRSLHVDPAYAVTTCHPCA